VGACGIDPIPFPGPTNMAPPPEDVYFPAEDVSVGMDSASQDSDDSDDVVDAVDGGPTLTVILQNDSDQSVWLQTVFMDGNPGWYTLSNTSEGPQCIHDDCGIANCDNLDDGVCGLFQVQVEELAPGANLQETWDGTIWAEQPIPNTPGDETCEAPVAATETEYTLTLCWGSSTSQQDVGVVPDAVTCVDRQLDWSGDSISLIHSIGNDPTEASN